MKVAIDVRDDVYNKIRKGGFWLESGLQLSDAYDAIKYGTPLPKGHGKLKDTDALKLSLTRPIFDDYQQGVIWKAIDSATTIIEADKSESEDK